MVSVRYIVDDVDKAIEFYTRYLAFELKMHPAPTFAILVKDDLRLLLNSPSTIGGGGQSMSDGEKPKPGGWNRISLQVSDLAAIVEDLRKKGARFRSDVIIGIGGNEILLLYPAGNLIELFEPKK